MRKHVIGTILTLPIINTLYFVLHTPQILAFAAKLQVEALAAVLVNVGNTFNQNKVEKEKGEK